MSRQRLRVKFDGILIAIMALLVLGGLVALGFLRDISKENRALIVMTSSVGIIGCFAGLMFLSAFRKRLRKRIWLRAMSAWNESSQARNAPNFNKANHLSEAGLRHLAVHIYSQMGYRIANREDEEVYLQLINPDRRIELIACKQQPDLIELHHVHSLQLEMKRTKAVRGFFWGLQDLRAKPQIGPYIGLSFLQTDMKLDDWLIVRMQKAHAFWNIDWMMIS